MSVAGKWQVSMDTPLGRQDFTWNLEQADGDYRGSMQSQAGPSPLDDIRVSGQGFRFAARIQGPMGSLALEFDGTVGGDAVSGTCRTRFGDFSFAGQRV